MDRVKNFVSGFITRSAGADSPTIYTNNPQAFPDPSTFGNYNLTIWSRENGQNKENTEIVRVTAREVVADECVLTVQRGQEDTIARPINVNYLIYLSPTQKIFDDIVNAIEQKTSPQTLSIQSGLAALVVKKDDVVFINHYAQLDNTATISITAESGDYFRLHLSNSASEEVVVAFTSSVSDDTVKIVGGETDTSIKLQAGKTADIYFDKFDKKITGHVEVEE